MICAVRIFVFYIKRLKLVVVFLLCVRVLHTVRKLLHIRNKSSAKKRCTQIIWCYLVWLIDLVGIVNTTFNSHLLLLLWKIVQNSNLTVQLKHKVRMRMRMQMPNIGNCAQIFTACATVILVFFFHSSVLWLLLCIQLFIYPVDGPLVGYFS